MVNILELSLLIVIVIVTLNFNWVLAHSAYGLGVVVGGFHLYGWLKSKSRVSYLSLQAILIAGVGALFYVNKWALSPWFNHIDIGHVSMAIGVWFFYKSSAYMN